MYYIYMLRCKDNSIYTGIASDLDKRMNEHFSKDEKCAKYTKSKTALRLERAWKTETRVDACKLEYRIKQLNKMQKETIIKEPESLDRFFKDKLTIEAYSIER